MCIQPGESSSLQRKGRPERRPEGTSWKGKPVEEAWGKRKGFRRDPDEKEAALFKLNFPGEGKRYDRGGTFRRNRKRKHLWGIRKSRPRTRNVRIITRGCVYPEERPPEPPWKKGGEGRPSGEKGEGRYLKKGEKLLQRESNHWEEVDTGHPTYETPYPLPWRGGNPISKRDGSGLPKGKKGGGKGGEKVSSRLERKKGPSKSRSQWF